jgi:hypothetical protein
MLGWTKSTRSRQAHWISLLALAAGLCPPLVSVRLELAAHERHGEPACQGSFRRCQRHQSFRSAQTLFDNIPVVDKKVHWIHGTSARCDGYLEFQRRPEPMLERFEKHMP